MTVAWPQRKGQKKVFDKMSAKVSKTIQELRQMREAFELFDKNKDGTICLKELKDVMVSLGRDPTDEELKGIFIRVIPKK